MTRSICGYPAATFLEKELLVAGPPKMTSKGLVSTPDGHSHVFASRGRTLYHYDIAPDSTFTKEIFAEMATAASTARGPDDAIHVVYLDLLNARLVHATNSGGSWTSEPIVDYEEKYDSFDHIPLFNVAVGPDNAVHVAYEDIELGGFAYATNQSGEWQCEIIFSFYQGIILNDSDKKGISVGEDGVVHYVTYRDEYGERLSGNWNLSDIPVDIKSEFIDLIIDDGNYPVVVWVSHQDEIWVTQKTDDGWTSVPVIQIAGLRAGIQVEKFAGEISTIVETDTQILNVSRIDDEWQITHHYTFEPWLTSFSTDALHGYPPEMALVLGDNRLIFTRFADDAWNESVLDEGIYHYWSSVSADAHADRVDVVWHTMRGEELADESMVWSGRREDGAWATAPLTPGIGPSLILDEDGFRHVAFWERSSWTLQLWDDTAGDWNAQEIETPPPWVPGQLVEFWWNAVDFSPEGLLNVAWAGLYMNFVTLDFGWSEWSGGNWETRYIDVIDPAYASAELQLLIAPDGTRHLIVWTWLFPGFSSGGVLLLEYWETESGWSESVVAYNENENQILGIDAVMDEDGKIYVTYGGDSNGPKLATGGRGDWATETLPQPDDGTKPQNAAVALGPDGRVYVAYGAYDPGRDCVSCAEVRAMTPFGGEWRTAVIDKGGAIGDGNMDMVVDEDSNVHLFYDGEQSIWYARFGAGYLVGE